MLFNIDLLELSNLLLLSIFVLIAVLIIIYFTWN